jgi:cytochrome oxidase Cu insertion factor (SCO1/SenC/PrrC family)
METRRKEFSKERFAGALLFVVAGYAIASIVAQVVLWRMGMPVVDYIPKPLSTGTVAPPFELTSLQGETVSLAQFKGRPVVLMFWGSS